MTDDWQEHDRWRTWWAAIAQDTAGDWQHGVARHVARYGGHWPRVTWWRRMRCELLSIVIPLAARCRHKWRAGR